MSKAPDSKRQRNGVAVDGVWLPLPCDFLASRAFARLSPLAVKMLFGIFMAQLRASGFGNGRLDAKDERLRAAGWSSPASVAAAIRELIEADLLVCTRRGAKGRLALYGLTPWPMHCAREGLEVGPGAWSVSDWRKAEGDASPPTFDQPAIWSRPRSAEAAAKRPEKRIRSPRGGSALAQCSTEAEVQQPEKAHCTTATVGQTGVSATNALPLRKCPSRKPSVRRGGAASGPAAMSCGMGRFLARRIRHQINPSHRAAVAALPVPLTA